MFPYEKVRPNSNILIYGAGTVGIEYLKQMLITKYCNVVAVIDRNYKAYSSMVIPVCSSDCISKLKYDYIIIALKSAIYIDEIVSNLLSQGVDKAKIICSFERDADVPIFSRENVKEDSWIAAYERSRMSIAILVSGGIGDMVIHKRLIAEIVKMAPECLIDIYCSGLEDFLKYLYTYCKNINEIILDLGTRYMEHCNEYGIGLELASTRYIHITELKKNCFIEEYPDFMKSIEKLYEESQKENFNFNTLLYSIYQRRVYNGENAYSALNYNGAFKITDKQVDIPLVKEIEQEFYALNLGEYITINYGNMTKRSADKVAKMWPYSYFEQIVIRFKKKYPTIKVIQVGEKCAPRIKGVDKYLLGEKFELLSYILKNAFFHFDIEGGLVHIASQLGTKCIVLFGPTSVEYFGYSNNINISAGTCHNCCGLYRDLYACARNMEKPECMYAITPELVMEHISMYMTSVLTH